MAEPGRKEQPTGQPGNGRTPVGELTRHFSLFVTAFRHGSHPSRAEVTNLAEAFDNVTQLDDPKQRVQAYSQLFQTIAQLYGNTPDSFVSTRTNGEHLGRERWTGR